MNKIIEYILLIEGILGLFSGMMWTFINPTDHWLWFSRFTVGIICLGFYAILKKLDNVRKTE